MYILYIYISYICHDLWIKYYTMKFLESGSVNQYFFSTTSQRCFLYGLSTGDIRIYAFPLSCSIVRSCPLPGSNHLLFFHYPCMSFIFSGLYPTTTSNPTVALWPSLLKPKHLQLQHCECLGTTQRLRRENPRNLSGALWEMHPFFLNETWWNHC